MDDTWLDREITFGDVQSSLQALSLRSERGAPVFAATTHQDGASDPGSGARLLFASRPLFALFGVADADGLVARLLQGSDPGARRLSTLAHTLTLDGAPRLERLRFFLGPASEVITVMCRRTSVAGHPAFVAAVLGLRAGLLPNDAPAPQIAMPAMSPRTAVVEAPPVTPASHDAAEHVVTTAQTVQDHVDTAAVAAMPGPTARVLRDAAALQADLRRRWPATRVLRFLWQTDADACCTLITPPLADVVGPATADLVGRNLLDLAPQLDPSGRLAARLAGRETWSGLDLRWPLADAAAAVVVTTGAIPAFDQHQGFEGFRGFGVIHLDRVEPADPVVLDTATTAPSPLAVNVVPFPSAKPLSADEENAFRQIGDALRLDAPQHPPADAATLPDPELTALPEATEALPETDQPRPGPGHDQHHDDGPSLEADLVAATPTDVAHDDAPKYPAHAPAERKRDIGRNALQILDRLGLALLVTRQNVPIFANRPLLEMLGFDNEDGLHEAGGLTHLFGGLPGADASKETVGVRHRDGTIVAATARMQVIDWDGLPATLLTLKSASAKDDREGEAKKRDDDAGRHREVELRELRAILETATDGVCVLDADCNVLSLNRSGEALFGCDRSEVIGKPFLTLFAPHNQAFASDYVDGFKSNATRSLLNGGREFLVRAHRGGTIPVFMTLGRLAPSAHETVDGDAPEGERFCALFRDLTPWKKAEQELNEARQEAERTSARKSDFLTKVSHEIRTPLNAIIGFAEVMMDERFGPLGNPRYKEYLKDIHGSGTHVMSLVNDLLDLSKIEAGKLDLNVVAIDANAIITECVAIMQPQASQERVIMRLSLAHNLPTIKADERSLRQIVLNLLSNAVKFNEPGGQVIVATTLNETRHIVIRIRDTGPGMSDADIETALEPFRQVATARQTTGTGLGLPLTKALVEANQASLTIRSKVDQGTLVEVCFPPSAVSV